jgi:serine/threonine protein kinase
VSPPEPPTLSPADLIGGRYRLTRRIARGGMAEVWEADDIILSRPVALKALLPRLASDEAFVIRFRREAVAAARLAHPNIVSIYDTCSEPGCEAIVMELVRGRTLRDELDEHVGMDMARSVDIAIQVAGALEHAHLHGLVHRDVKPANILLGGDGRVLVADFGIAKALRPGDIEGAGPDASDRITLARPAGELHPADRHADGHHHDLTAIGDVMGTAKYLAPEQVQGNPVDARVDVYALGIVLYEMLCGRPPFVGVDASATAAARLTDEPLRPRQVRAGIPRQLEDITLRALARDPGSRYPSAGAFKAALTSIDLSPFEIGHPDPTTTFAYDRKGAAYEVGDGYAGPERTWLVPAALIVVIAVTLGVVGVLVGRTDVGRGLFESVGVTSAHDRPVTIDSATTFDPLGDGKENDDQVRFAVDGNPNTGWQTENYFSQRFGGLKAGVGIVLHVPASTNVQSLVLTSPSRGWTASIYVGDGRATDIGDWGQPVGSVSADDSRSGSVTVSVGGHKTVAVLVWITDLGERNSGAYRFELREAALRG